MSKKLKAAIQTGTVVLLSKSAGETMIRYVDRNNTVQRYVLGSFQTVEMAPKMTTADRLRHSNIEDCVRDGSITVL